MLYEILITLMAWIPLVLADAVKAGMEVCPRKLKVLRLYARVAASALI